jgi:hypothetical protein
MAEDIHSLHRRCEEKAYGSKVSLISITPPKYGNYNRAILVCSEHGEFEMEARHFLSGHSCAKCGHERVRIARTLPDAQIINGFMNTGVYSDLDSFSRAEGKQKWTFVCAACLVDEYAARGCETSWGSCWSMLSKGSKPCRCAKRHRWTKKEMEIRLELMGVDVSGWVDGYKCKIKEQKVITRCAEHGDSIQNLSDVLYQRNRCIDCSKPGFQRTKDGYLYLLKSQDGSLLKVGISNKPAKRMKELRKDTPFDFDIVSTIHGDGYWIAEKESAIHRKFKSAQLSGFDGSTEWMLYNENIVEIFDSQPKSPTQQALLR